MITAVKVRKDAAPQKTHPQVLTISRGGTPGWPGHQPKAAALRFAPVALRVPARSTRPLRTAQCTMRAPPNLTERSQRLPSLCLAANPDPRIEQKTLKMPKRP